MTNAEIKSTENTLFTSSFYIQRSIFIGYFKFVELNTELFVKPPFKFAIFYF
jgi:hypothetical protein